jgi:phosphomannomutase
VTLIKSISGIRGTLGGYPGENLTPIDVVQFVSGFGSLLEGHSDKPVIVIGRDARPSGVWISLLAQQIVRNMGMEVIDLGLSTTPTVEMAVIEAGASGGIMITASHNPKEWNALKFIEENGDCMSEEKNELLLEAVKRGKFRYSPILGGCRGDDSAIDRHIDKVLNLNLVDKEMISAKRYRIVLDAINSTGAISITPLLESLGCSVHVINGDISGNFAHDPEPLPKNLEQLSQIVQAQNADLGIAVDPDVDRLAFVTEKGDMFGEEYTLVAVADHVLKHSPGPAVSNMSSTQALKVVAEKHGCPYYPAPVGEVNVVKKMKEVNAQIGGEGNGGIIYPALHYGRDALVGTALFLSLLAQSGMLASELKNQYPDFKISKKKVSVMMNQSLDTVLKKIQNEYSGHPMNTDDGLKVWFGQEWVHLRKSNTEPVLRIYAESDSESKADILADEFVQRIRSIVRLM